MMEESIILLVILDGFANAVAKIAKKNETKVLDGIIMQVKLLPCRRFASLYLP